MRDPKRIDPFLQELGDIWKNNCPDWRFGQFIENTFGNMNYIPWMLEENQMLDEFHRYFEKDIPIRTYTRKRGRKSERKNNGKNS